MKKLNVNQIVALQGGSCINRDGLGQEMSGIGCPGFCMATTIVFANTGSGINGMVCLA